MRTGGFIKWLVVALAFGSAVACSTAFVAAPLADAGADGGVDASTGPIVDAAEAGALDAGDDAIESGDAGADSGDACATADLTSDFRNCGACGNVCATRTCVQSACDPLVFATFAAVPGNLGGFAGADAMCNSAAAAAGVTGTFKAWLGSDNVGKSPASDFTRSTRPYRNRDGVAIAMSYATLVTSSLLTTITETEDGGPLQGGSHSWSDVASNGNANGTADCSIWTSALDASIGNQGDLTSTTGTWTNAFSLVQCNQLAHVVCFQQ